MPSEVYKVTQIIDRPEKDQVTVRDVNRLVTELNKMLSQIAVELGKIRGQDGAVSKFVGDVDLDGHNILNAAAVKFSSRQHARGEAQPFSGVYVIDAPTDTPLTADDLRDDIADNVLPDVETALNDLGKNLKRVLDVLKI